ncbi:MATE family efflux transporter [Christensenellaceae bacterium OttesenSCG-928-M15]|nr:MATE family efflux transporter [Christensenellaceae bacterium OttesenSCG-928-M15]
MKRAAKSNQTLNLVEGNIGKTLVRFAVPFLLSSILQALYGAVDIFVVGHFASPAHVSAISVGSQIMSTLTFFAMGICTGGTILVGQFAGAKDGKNVSSTIGNLILISVGLAVIMTSIVLLLHSSIIAFMRTPAEAVVFAADYMVICAFGLPFVVGYNLVSGILRGFGDSKSPLLFVFVASVVNIVFDVYLVKELGMGAAGAAIATSGSQAVSLLFSLVYLKFRGLPFPFKVREHLRFKKALFLKVFSFGLPLALQNILVNISFLLITMITNAMGLIVSAAVGVVDKVSNFVLLIPSSISNAVSAMVAQNIGAGQHDRALKSMRAGIYLSLCVCTLACIWTQVAPQTLTAIFASDEEVIKAGAMYLRAYGIDSVIVCFVFNMNAYFNGCGKSYFTMAHNISTTFLIRIPVSYILSRIEGMTLLEIGMAVPLASFVSMLMCLYFLKRSKEQMKQQALFVAPANKTAIGNNALTDETAIEEEETS